jgi:predicted transcriptional regulator
MAKRITTQHQAYRLRIVRDGLEFEAEGDRTFVLDMVDQFVKSSSRELKGKERSIPSREPGQILPISPDKGMSIREFILQLKSRKHTDLVLAFGYYLEKVSGQSAFAPADLNNLYYEAKLDTSNTSQMIIQNIKRGHMMEAKKGEAGGKKEYVLTHSGEKYIEELMAPPVA